MLLCDGVKCFRLSIDDIMFFGERTGHVRDLETNLEWLLSLIWHQRQKETYLGVPVITFVGQRVPAKWVEPFPGMVEAKIKVHLR